MDNINLRMSESELEQVIRALQNQFDSDNTAEMQELKRIHNKFKNG